MNHAGVVVTKVALAQRGIGDSLSTLGENFHSHDAEEA